MTHLSALIKKELLGQARSGKLLILFIVALFFGIMNPATAKLTPWLLSTFADSLEQSGIQIGQVTVTAIDSWMQFFKNLPIFLTVFVLMEGGVLANESRSGALILTLTKGVSRRTVLLSKLTLLSLLYTVLFGLGFGVTYAYTVYFWDNSIISNLLPTIALAWVFGLLLLALLLFFSAFSNSFSGVLLGVGGVLLLCSIPSLLPKLASYSPFTLINGMPLLLGSSTLADYLPALFITLVLILLFTALSFPLFAKKQL